MANRTVDEMRDIYSTIYGTTDVIHPKKGRLEPYGLDTKRDPLFMDYIQRHVAPGSTVLDASCGRGHLLKQLIVTGYNASGTEFVQNVVDYLKLAKLPVLLCAYHELLDKFKPSSFDVVISNDVLEHMENEQAAIDAIESLSTISKEYVMISVGVGQARKFPSSLNLPIHDLHTVRRTPEWWVDRVSRFVNLDYNQLHGSWYGFGKKRS